MAMKSTLQVQEVLLVSSVIIQHFNGKKFDLDKLGYRVQMVSPFGSNWTQAVTQLNRYVNIVQQPKAQPKTFTLTLAMNCQDITGLQLKYEALSMIFNGEYYFWLYLADIPHIRWEVTVSGEPQYTPQGTTGYGTASITLYCAKGFAETTHSTADIPTDQGANSYDLGLFGIGTHFPHSGINPVYSSSSPHVMQIYNAGTIALRAKGLHGKIICYNGDGLSIDNNANGTSFHYRKPYSKLVLDGYSCFADGQFDFVNSDKGHIDLERGWNQIITSGPSKVTFDLHFYY